MKNSNYCVHLGWPALVAFVACASVTSAATVIWDGTTDANLSGTWETGLNWSTDAIPAVADTASLGNVTSGTRTVTISSGSPQTIRALSITQTTVGTGIGTVLQLDDNLTISGGATPFTITATAGQDKIVTNIAANKTLLASHTASITSSSYAGTINMAAGSTFKVSAVGTNADLTLGAFGGPINATGAGAQIIFQRTRNLAGSLGFNGAIGVTGDGSTLTLKSLTASNTVTSIGAVTFGGDDGAGNSVKLGAGTQFNVSGNGGTYSFTNKVSLAGAASPASGAQMAIVGTNGSGTTTGNFNGGLVLGAGAKLTISEGSSAVNLAGTSSLGAGAQILLQFTGDQGSGRFLNSGSFTMDGATLNLDWAAGATNNGTRDYRNTGTWTLKNNSSVALISSTGRPVAAGFGNFRNNSNTGTLSVQSGSTIGFGSLLSTGTLNLGSSTSGASDAQVVAGSPLNTFADVLINNGYTTGGATLNVLGNAFLGRPTAGASGTAYLDNGTVRNGAALTTGTDSTTGSIVNIGDGSTPVLLTVANLNATVTNATGNTIDVKNGATLLMKSTGAGATTTGAVTLTNRGTLTQAGSLSFQGNFNGGRAFSNGAGSTYRISGQNAGITALPGNGSGTNVAAITFTSAGLVTGATAHDKLTYTNSTGSGSFATLALSVNSGEITPGNGSNGVGLASIGTLEFANTNITLTGTSKLTFDIGGTAASARFDQLIVGNKTFALGAGTGSVLDIWLVNDYGTATAQSYSLISATGGSISGSFTTLLFNGQVVTNEYTVGIVGDQLVLNLAEGLGTLIPEPSTTAVLMAAGAGLVVALRRRRRA